MNLAVVMKSINSKLICRPAAVAGRTATQRGPLVARSDRTELVPLQVLVACFDRDWKCIAAPQNLVYVDPEAYHGRIGKRVLTAPGYEEQVPARDNEPARSVPVQFIIVDYGDVVMVG